MANPPANSQSGDIAQAPDHRRDWAARGAPTVSLPRFPVHRDTLTYRLIAAMLGGGLVRFAGMVMVFVVGVQLARALGPSGYGVYGTVMALVAILVVPAKLGLSSLIVREISASNRPDHYGKAKGVLIGSLLTIAAMSAVMSAIGFVVYLIWPGLLPGDPGSAILWGLAIVPLYALIDMTSSTLMGFHRTVLAQSLDALVRPGLFAIALVANIAIAPLDAAASLKWNAISSSVTLIAGFLVLKHATPAEIRNAAPVFEWRRWTFSVIPMVGTEIIRTIDGNFGVLLIGYLVTIDAAGLFRIAAATAGLLAMPLLVIKLTVPPFAARLHVENDSRRLELLASSASAASFGAMLAILLGLVFFGGRLIALAFGAAFAPALPMLLLLCAGYTAAAFVGATNFILNVTGKERTVTMVVGLAMFLNISLSLILGALYGAVGVASAFAVAEVFKAVIVWHKAQVDLGIDTSAASFIKRAILG
jgi:O-antigen/teichoic acid export membrane protein